MYEDDVDIFAVIAHQRVTDDFELTRARARLLALLQHHARVFQHEHQKLLGLLMAHKRALQLEATLDFLADLQLSDGELSDILACAWAEKKTIAIPSSKP